MTSDQGMSTTVLMLRRRVQRTVVTMFAPLVNWLANRGVRPDHITWAGFGLAVAAAAFAGLRVFALAGILFLLSGVADLIDGALARRAALGSGAGAFLDSLLDRAGEGLLHAGAAVAFALWGLWPGVLAVALSLTGSFLTSYARARAQGLGIALEEAWFSRGERVLLLGFGLIFHFALLAFWIVAAVAWATVVQRAFIARVRLAVSGTADEKAPLSGRAPSGSGADETSVRD